VPRPATAYAEDDSEDIEEAGTGREPRAARKRRPNSLVTGPMWSL